MMRHRRQQRNNGTFEIFNTVAFCAVPAAIVTAWVTASLIPIVVVGIGLAIGLAALNGMGP